MGRGFPDRVRSRGHYAHAREAPDHPTLYCPELIDEICERIVGGESLRSVCRDPDMPRSATVLRWLQKHPEFERQYARACEARTEAWAERIIEIADSRNDRDVQSRRLEIDTLKWLMAKLAPKKYGKKTDHEHGGTVTIEIVRFSDGKG